MRLSVINAASKTSLAILRGLIGQSPQQYASIKLMDYFPTYDRFENCFNFKDRFPLNNSHISLMKLEHRYSVEKEIRNSDHLLYFTHDYFQNVTCKNELKKSIAEMVSNSKNLKKAIFVNLFEYSKFDDPLYFESALALDHHIAADSKNNLIFWSDLIYGNDSSLSHHLKTRRVVKFDGAMKRWVSVFKVVDVLANAFDGRIPSQLNYIGKTDYHTGKHLVESLRLGEDANDSRFFMKVLAPIFMSAESNYYQNLLQINCDIASRLLQYTIIDGEKVYPKLNRDTI